MVSEIEVARWETPHVLAVLWAKPGTHDPSDWESLSLRVHRRLPDKTWQITDVCNLLNRRCYQPSAFYGSPPEPA